MTLTRRTEGAVPRAAVAAVEVTAVAGAAHTWAGGLLPSPGQVVITAVPLFVAGLWFFRGKVGLSAALAAAVAGQATLHVLFAGASAHAGHTPESALPMLVAHGLGALATVVAWSLRCRAWSAVVASTARPAAVIAGLPAALTTAGHIPVPRALIVTRPLRGPPVGACGH